MKRLADILLSLAALLLLAACTDDADVYNTPASSEGNLCVYVPVTREGDAITSSLSSSNPTYNASVEECQINDLHLYAFPVGVEGTFLSQELLAPQANEMINEKVARYQLQIKPGTYHVYVVANMEDVLKDKTINTEADLKNVVLSYNPNNPMSTTGMPVAGKIPMIYEPKAADGTTTSVIIKKKDTTPQTVVANMRFTCVKVCLNLVYDPNAPGVSSALKTNGLQITDVIGKRLSQQTNLLWNGKFTNPDVSSEYATGFESTLYDADASKGNGAYYTTWIEDSANANINDQNIITVDGEGVAKLADINQKWLFRATYYLPERYVAKASQQSALKIGGAVGGAVGGSVGGSAIKNSYNINLGHRKDETSTSEVPTFPRGTYYEIVGRIKSLGNIDLDCVVGVKDWEMATIDVDLNHTTLWVSSTKAEVGSQKVAFIDYLTNVTNGDIELGCVTEIEKNLTGKLPVIVATNEIATHRIRFSINPALSVKDFTDAKVPKGTAKVWIKAGNIKKYLDVEYDVTPYFKVDPVDIVIFWDDKNKEELTKVVNFSTNLGGIQFPSDWSNNPNGGYDVSYAQSTINIKCKDPKVADGQFTITATSNPGTTTTHVFTVKSIEKYKDADGNEKYMEQPVRVTVRPPKGNYIIYMRAINDLAKTKDASNLEEFEHSDMLDEEAYNNSEENNNWRDGWCADWKIDRKSYKDSHKVYIYTQKGETNSDGTKDENVAIWYFTGGWPGVSMTADNNNPGWYYYSIAHDAKSEFNNGQGDAKTTPQKMIKPGQTLLIFSNGTYTSEGYQPHRFTHHNDPGITLFNYEDREGWYLYDPLSDPYYRVYDEKPTVVDVEYTIYTKNKRITAWYCKYGVNSQDGTGKFEMKSNNPNVEKEFKCTECDKKDKDGNTWYKTILHLKAPLGEYDKILKLKVNGDEIHTELFGGENYPSTKKNGNRYVVEGRFDTDTKKWSKGAPF